MKAIIINRYGNADCLKVEQRLIPTPNEGEVLVKLKAIGVNYIDIYMREGDPLCSLPPPFIPGVEGSGIIEAVGINVTEVKVGDCVSFLGSIGSYAEYAVVPVSRIIPLIQEMSFEEGAAFSLAGLTAQYLVHDCYKVKAGDNVLVHAAAGGVGLFLIQMLKQVGARVIGTVSSPEKGKIAKFFGADDIIIYTNQDFAIDAKRLTNGKGVDYILDGVGKKTFYKNLEACRIKGHIAIFGFTSGQIELLAPNLLQEKSITITGGNLMNYLTSHEELIARAKVLMEDIKYKKIKVHIDRVFPLEQAKDAHTLLKSRKSVGKIILMVT